MNETDCLKKKKRLRVVQMLIACTSGVLVFAFGCGVSGYLIPIILAWSLHLPHYYKLTVFGPGCKGGWTGAGYPHL